MALERESKKNQNSEEKAWENPENPINISDDRDKEQLLRQYKEAKRRKDNLTGEQNEEQNN